MPRKRTSKRPVLVRAVYDPAIRDVIKLGELDRMKAMLVKAKALLKKQGDLKAAVARLEAAIKQVGQS